MSIGLIVTRGFGNGTLVGSIKDVVTRGYTIGDASTVAIKSALRSFISSLPISGLSEINSISVAGGSEIIGSIQARSFINGKSISGKSIVDADGLYGKSEIKDGV